MRPALAAALLFLAGCAGLAGAPGVDVLLLGEQHDAAGHPRLQQDWVERLARNGTLAALAVEMAERGRSTAGLPRDATEDDVRAALAWNDKAWPWPRYGPVVMAAVRAGVPVAGANLPMARMRERMQDASLDARLPAADLARQAQAIREGHCQLLPEAQVPGMTRVQIARDIAMAETIREAHRPGKTVVLVAGAGHVDEQVGVPRHLPPTLRARSITLPPEPTGRDYCGELRERMGKAAGAQGGAARPGPAPHRDD